MAEGDLWSDPEAAPEANPAGWWFRDHASKPWIGPYARRAEAEEARASGDALGDAQRRLARWLKAPEKPVREEAEEVAPALSERTPVIEVAAAGPQPPAEPEPQPEPAPPAPVAAPAPRLVRRAPKIAPVIRDLFD